MFPVLQKQWRSLNSEPSATKAASRPKALRPAHLHIDKMAGRIGDRSDRAGGQGERRLVVLLGECDDGETFENGFVLIVHGNIREDEARGYDNFVKTPRIGYASRLARA
jgi:hypothetical protein